MTSEPQAAEAPSIGPSQVGPETEPSQSRSALSSLYNRARAYPFTSIWVVTIALYFFAAVLTPSVLNATAQRAMAPSVAVLAIVAVGQTLVIQQRGLDFSIAGVMAISIAIVARVGGDGSGLPLALVLCALTAVAVGLVSGVAVVFFDLPPLIATLGVNALLVGIALGYSGGGSQNVAGSLNDFMIGDSLGIPHPIWLSLVVIIVVAAITARTFSGRRFVAIGAGALVIRAAGGRVGLMQIGTYVVASLCYAVAAVVYAGHLGTPAVNGGQPYLLQAITAVVLGGTALTGGRGSVVASAVASLFVVQLLQVAYAIGGPPSTQYLLEAAVIAAAVLGPRLVRAARGRLTFPLGNSPNPPRITRVRSYS